ncbi:unnamed protein product, partial [Rotaria magnacalcarata]
EQTHIVSTTNITCFGSWNVRSCYRVTKRELIVRQLKRYQIEVAALAETNIPNSGIYVVNEYTFIYSRASEKERTRAAHGAAVCLGPKASRAWRNSGSIWRPVNSRIVAVRIKCQSIPITVIAVYAPVNPSNGLNARVGVEQASSAQSVVGKHAVDKQNQNGRRLADFCLFNGFMITNTFFPHKPVHQTTWMHPKTKKWHMFDYILVNRKFRNSIQDVRAHRGETGGIGADHHLLRAKVRLHLKCRKKTTETDQKYQKNTKEWFTHEIADIVDKKANAYVQWQHHRGKIGENKYRNQYRMLAKTVKMKDHDPATAFQIIRRLRGNAEVRIDGDFSSSIQMNTGVKQGCLLSPILFNVYIDFVMRQILKQAGTEGITMNYRLGDLWYSGRGKNDDIRC